MLCDPGGSVVLFDDPVVPVLLPRCARVLAPRRFLAAALHRIPPSFGRGAWQLGPPPVGAAPFAAECYFSFACAETHFANAFGRAPYFCLNVAGSVRRIALQVLDAFSRDCISSALLA